MKSVVKITETIIFVMALAIVVCIVTCQLVQVKPVVVLSGSMEPAIKTGSLAFIDEREKTIQKGDVIAYELGDMLVSHRVVDITEEGFKTKGDNNDTEDIGIVKLSDVKGTIAFSIPALGFILKTIVLPAGILMSLLCITLKVILRGKRLC